MPTNLPIRLYWTPGHEGIEMNERADQAAREAAEDNEEQLLLPTSLGGLLRHSRKLIEKRGVVSIPPYKTKSRYIADALNILGKGEAAAIFQLRCGHCPLKQYLHRIGREESDKCDECRVKETPTHYLIYCKRYTRQRRAFRRKLKEEEITVNINSAVAILDTPKVYPYLAEFIQETERFPHLRTYVEA